MTTQLIGLCDGRRLAVRCYGAAGGPVVFYFHGHPGSRLDWAMIDPDQRAAAHGVRVIALDRPGYGASTPAPGRQLLDWPGDVLAAADHLGVEQFSVLGYSGGGPFALACAHRISGDRLTATTVVAGMGPADSPGQARSLGWWLYSGARPSIRSTTIPASAWASRRTPDRAAIALAGLALPRADRRALRDPRVAAGLLATWREAFAHGSAGAQHDVAIYTQPWGFELAEVAAPVTLWHGTADRNVPVSVGRHVAGLLPDARLHELPGHGHVSVFTDLPAIVESLRQQ